MLAVVSLGIIFLAGSLVTVAYIPSRSICLVLTLPDFPDFPVKFQVSRTFGVGVVDVLLSSAVDGQWTARLWRSVGAVGASVLVVFGGL